MRRYIFFVLSAVFLFVGGIAAADTAPPANPDLAKLQKMVDNLGYTATLSHDGKFITVQWPSSNYTNPISLQINQTHTLVYAYVDLLSYTQAQLAKLDSNKLLEASDSGDFFFSMEKIKMERRRNSTQIQSYHGLTSPRSYCVTCFKTWPTVSMVTGMSGIRAVGNNRLIRCNPAR
jgi:hypothetical protein